MQHCILHVSAQVYNCRWVTTYVHTCTNETHPLASLQDLIPTLANTIDILTGSSLKADLAFYSYIVTVSGQYLSVAITFHNKIDLDYCDNMVGFTNPVTYNYYR